MRIWWLFATMLMLSGTGVLAGCADDGGDDDATSGDDDATIVGDDDATGGDDDATGGDDDATGGDDDATGGDDDATGGDDDATGGDDDATGGDDDATGGDDDATGGDDDATGGDDDATGGDDDASGGGDDDATQPTDADQDGSPAAVDCDDHDSTVYPGANELCDDKDNDCDGQIDETAPIWYTDTDGDGYGDPASSTSGCVAPVGSVSDHTDCDDDNAGINPGASEVCDSIDNNCDGQIDGPDSIDAGLYFEDQDGDSYGNPAVPSTACSQPAGFVSDNSDCNDGASSIHPGAAETCNSLDDNCNGQVDESSATDASTWYADADGDGYGNGSSSTKACSKPAGYVADSGDCDDTRAAVHPGATELCNGLDDNCNGAVDEAGAQGASTWYADGDGDGYGNGSSSVQACGQPAGYVEDASDCDDANKAVNPGATEVCNGIDDDCDAAIDEASAQGAPTWYADADGDTYGDPASSQKSCSQPAGYVRDNTDCNDSVKAVNPGATELCNGVDDNCNGAVDEAGAANAATWFADGDGDGYGTDANSTKACSQPAGYVKDTGDCNDANAAVHPGATELCNGIDDNCNSQIDESTASDASTWYPDADGDGYGGSSGSVKACSKPTGYVSGNTDCNDSSASIHPGATEICNGKDDNCDGVIPRLEKDTDGDGVIACDAALWVKTDAAVNTDPTSTGVYGAAQAAALLTAKGITIKSARLSTTTIDAALLNNYGLLIVTGTDTDGQLSSGSAADMQQWIIDGGGLLFIAYDPSSKDCELLNTFPKALGMSCSGHTGWSGTSTSIVSHPVTTSLTTVSGLGGELYQVASPAKTVISVGTNPFLVVSELGAGRAVFITDEWPFYNSGTGSGSDITYGSNKQMVDNIWAWLINEL